MKAEGKGSKAPLTDSFLRYPNNKYVLLALLGATGRPGVWSGTRAVLCAVLPDDHAQGRRPDAYTLIAISLLLGTPFFIFFGWLSDKIGRLKIILAGCLIAALDVLPPVRGADALREPGARDIPAEEHDLGRGQGLQLPHLRRPVVEVHRVRPHKDFLTKAGLSFTSTTLPADSPDTVVTKISDTELKGFDAAKYNEALKAKGYAPAADKNAINWPDDPADPVHPRDLRDDGVRADRGVPGRDVPDRGSGTRRCRCPYHIGNGWFGGHAAAAGHRNGGGVGRHLLRPMVTDRRRADERSCIGGLIVPEGSQGHATCSRDESALHITFLSLDGKPVARAAARFSCFDEADRCRSRLYISIAFSAAVHRLRVRLEPESNAMPVGQNVTDARRLRSSSGCSSPPIGVASAWYAWRLTAARIASGVGGPRSSSRARSTMARTASRSTFLSKGLRVVGHERRRGRRRWRTSRASA
jgi:hypothetical protein